ncbi:GIY-YIG nuclease family protein [uncultured Brevundimonas sp.]|uniref:GIY-YIG nuclease family protein n=1 Tax=uncultured Brevundimonas sp. TaxID=213418 RepID=UPI0034544C25
MASRRNGAIYTGMTANLTARVWKHRNGVFDGFTKQYGCTRLVWFQPFAWVVEAIRREKQIKERKRDWKLALIERDNPDCLDLAADWFPGNDPDRVPPVEENGTPRPALPCPTTAFRSGCTDVRRDRRRRNHPAARL